MPRFGGPTSDLGSGSRCSHSGGLSSTPSNFLNRSWACSRHCSVLRTGLPFTLRRWAKLTSKHRIILYRSLPKEFISVHADRMRVNSTKDRNTPEDPGRGEPGHADEPTQPVDPARLRPSPAAQGQRQPRPPTANPTWGMTRITSMSDPGLERDVAWFAIPTNGPSNKHRFCRTIWSVDHTSSRPTPPTPLVSSSNSASCSGGPRSSVVWIVRW